MTEVAPADHSKLLQSKRAECSSIVKSRKRKLRELFAVATEIDGIPNRNFRDPDASPTTPAESQFILDADILHGRILDELKIPPRQRPHFDTLQRFLASSGASLLEKAESPPSKVGFEKPSPATRTTALPTKEPTGTATPPRDSNTSQRATKDVSSVSRPAITPIKAVQTPPRDAPIGPVEEARTKGSHSSSAEALAPRQDIPVQATSADSEWQEVQIQGRNGSGDVLQGELQMDRGISKGTHVTPIVQAPSGVFDHNMMDIGNVPEQRKQEGPDHLSTRLVPTDSSKVPDTLSSPGSTAQTVTTPAVHEASTDTSPDNEGPQYVDHEEERTEDVKAQEVVPGQGRAAAAVADSRERQVSPNDSQGTAINGVEAQLLQESAAASAAQSVDTTPAPVEFAVGNEGPTKETEIISNLPGSDHNADGMVPGSTHPRTLSPHKTESTRSEIRDSQEPSPAEPMEIEQPAHVAEGSKDQPSKEAVGAAQSPPMSTTVAIASQAERAVTRTSSGAIKQKSVAKILGGTVKTPSGPIDSLPTPREHDSQTSTEPSKVPVDKSRSKGRPRTPTVVFGKPQKSKADDTAMVPSRSKPSNLLSEDYFTPLFVQNFAQQSKWMKHIDQLVHHAHKAISTPDLHTAMLENQACKILKRVYHLQQQDKWSLRQPKRCPEPTRPPSHWDILLQEMKWMRTDFREERKWKRAAARNLALSCAEWVASSPEQRKVLRVNAVLPPVTRTISQDVPMVNSFRGSGDGNDGPATPDLIPSGDSDSPVDPEEEPRDNFQDTVAPSAIFALEDDDVVFQLHRSPTSDQLLDELPLYGSPLKVPNSDLISLDYDPDARWRRPALPLSKYVEGQIVLTSEGPPSKRSRYQYIQEEEDDDDDERVVFGAKSDDSAKLDRQNKDVALFNPDMKPIRDRLHAGHQFRPPTDHSMPLQSFYECRQASQWTWAEDDQLKVLVREHSYNWSLISSILSSKSTFASGPERRTSWECFERWVHLEGLPNDMAKTQYFKTYQNRIDAAQRVIMEQNQKIQHQAGPNGAMTPVQKRRPTTTVRVERRRNQKHLALIDAMRKLAKKRETTVQKQQHAASLAAMRKANEPQQQQRLQNKTPKEYSLMRFERDQQLAEKMAQYAQRQQEVQRRQLMARGQGQVAAAAGGSTSVPPQVAAQMAANPLAAAARTSIPSQLSVPGQARPRMPLQTPPNAMVGVQGHVGSGLVPPISMNNIPQAQMQAAIQAQHRMQMPGPQPDMNLVLQAKYIQDQQRAAVQRQQQVQQQQQQAQQQQGQQSQQMPQGTPGSQGSPTGMRSVMNGINQQNFMTNAQAMMASFNAANGTNMGTPMGPGLNMPSLPAGSPRAHSAQANQIPPALMAQIRDYEAQLMAKNPSLTPQEAHSRAIQSAQQIIALHARTNAMSAAAGGGPQQALMNGMTGTSPHQYAQLLRAQQQAQAAATQQSTPHQRQPSTGSTPVSK